MEEDALIVYRDFHLAIDFHNNNSASNFKLSVDQTIVNASDVFQFSRASKQTTWNLFQPATGSVSARNCHGRQRSIAVFLQRGNDEMRHFEIEGRSEDR